MKKLLISASFMLLLLAACQPVAPEDTSYFENAQPVAPEQAQPIPPTPYIGPGPTWTPRPTTVEGLCDNPYFPVVEGATWNYDMTTNFGTATSTNTITDVGTDGFLMVTDNPNVSYVITWECSAEGLYWLQSTGGMFAAVFQTDAGTGTVQTISFTGVSIPAEVQPGDSWISDEEITASGFGVGETFTIYTDYHAVGMETVTVQAGTFDALRVDFTMTNTSEKLPVSIEGTSWFAAGVGQVKTTGLIGDISSDLELVSYSIP